MREPSDSAALLKSAVARTIKQAKRHPVSLDAIEKEVAREMGSQKTPKIVGIIKELVGEGAVIVFDGTFEEYYWKDNLTGLKTRLCEVLKIHKTNNPISPFLKSKDAMKRFSKTKTAKKQRNIDPKLFAMTIDECRRLRLLIETEEGMALADGGPRQGTKDLQEELRSQVLEYVKTRAHQRLDPVVLAGKLGQRAPVVKKLLKDLVSLEQLIYIEDGRYLEPTAVLQARALIARHLCEKDGAHVSELMTLLAAPRRGTIAILEYFDRVGFTRREGDLRVLSKGSVVSSI